MKNMKNIIWIGLVALFSACHEDITDGNGIRGGDQVVLNAEIMQQYVTRASDGGFADGDQIGVFVVNRDNGEPLALKVSGNYADNVRYTYNAAEGKWTGSYQLYWKDKNTHADAYGYYPFDADMSSVVAYPFMIQRNQSTTVKGKTITGYEASDFLWAKAEDVAAGTPIHLKHHHVMAGVEITLVEGNHFDEGEWSTLEKSVSVMNTRTATTINIGTGEVSISGSDVSSITPQQRGTTWRAVVAPQTVNAEAPLLAITVNGISYEFKRPTDMVYYSGKLHKFTLAVNKQLPKGDYEFTLLTESITPWENDAESHNGAAREYITVHIDEGEYIGNVIDEMGLDPAKIQNLKLTGCLVSAEDQFRYMREQMPKLIALNMKELRTKQVGTGFWSWDDSQPTYGFGQQEDDFIPENAFENATLLAYVTWPDSLKGIAPGAFAGAGLRGSLILPEGLRCIGSGAFNAYGHASGNLSGELYIPTTVEFIGDGAFGMNDGRSQIYFSSELQLPAKMKYLGGSAFLGCAYMTGVVRVPEGIETVYTDSWPVQLTGPMVIPQGVKKILGGPIWDSQITGLDIPEGVEEIGNNAFWGASKVRTSLIIPSSVKRIGEYAFNRTGITHVTLPDGLEYIERYAFAECENLQDTLTIPTSVVQIREGAFANCRQLTAIILPADLQEIQGAAFEYCYSMDYIQCLGSTPPVIADNSFNGVEKNNFTVVVPEGAVEAYRNAPGWNEFKRISAYRNFVCRPMKAKLLNKSNVRDIVLNADESWTVKSCPSWVHLDKTSGYKKTELKATIDALPHGSADRKDKIVFQLNRNDEQGEPITCDFEIEQYDYEYDEDAVLQLQKATKGQRGGIDILFVGDGYDAEDIARGTYREHMEQEMEYFFAIEPYKTYKDYFNVSMAMAMSYESGVVDSPDKWRNTKFNVTWSAGGCNGRLKVDFDEIGRYVLQDITQCPVTANNVGRSLIICVPNSDAYEGLTAMYTDGSAIAVCPHSTWDYPNDARGIIQHEAGGHGWAKLDDEYIYHNSYIQRCSCICCSHVDGVEAMHENGWGRNVSLTGKYQEMEWRHLVFDKRYGDICDVYEGAHMHAKGIYRPEVNSCMNNNVPYYNTWSRQLMVERIMEVSGETFDFETFVSKDSREWGDKFLLTRSQMITPWQSAKAVYSEHHAPVIKKGSPMDFQKKKGGKR